MDIDDFRTPGQLIEALLEERGWTQRLLAVILGEYETGINKIIAGKKPVTAKMALLLGEVFDLDPDKFMDLQKVYDLAQARLLARPDPDRATRTAILGGLPVSEMIKRRWIDAEDVRNVDKVEKALVKFFGVESINEIEILPHAARKTKTFTSVTPAQLAWIYRVKQIASEMLVARYSPAAVRNAVDRLSNLLSAPEEARKVPRILTECGIRYVVVESLSSTKIDGVCFWLDNQSPIIGMSLRFDRIDNFWFVLRHELEHVLQRHGQTAIMLDAELEGERAGTGDNIVQEERIANEAAAEFCVPQKKIESFIARKTPFFNERDIIGIARTLQIHPGLIAGQLQYRTGRYDLFRKHLSKIRSFVSPSAMIDGWGDVYPVGL
jgi:HTH-type transcriptional regulator/antitoxin HigA